MRESVEGSSPSGTSEALDPAAGPGPTVEADDPGRPALRLLAVSFAALLLELALIRYVNSTVQVIAFFNNLLVVAAFLGLGLGSLLPKRRRLLDVFPLLLALAVAAMSLFEGFGYAYDFKDDILGLAIRPGMLPVSMVVAVVFVLAVAVFVPLGNQLGHWLARCPDRLEGYGYDIAGSLLGVLAFALLSALRTPPWVWFACGGAAVFSLAGPNRKRRAFMAAGLVLTLAMSLLPAPGTWSPYYKVQLAPLRTGPDTELLGYAVLVDNVRIQDALNFSGALARSPLAGWMDYYRLPYVLTRPRSVLVLGGGSGNDASAALAYGAERVDVVEIDPVILSLGFEAHPHRPYQDPRVRTINDDARAFLRRATGTYDLIVMNALDSHHQLPGLSTLRLESYVYTVESFRDARRLMHPGSALIVHLTSAREWMGNRLYWSLNEAFGEEPRLFWAPRGDFPVVSFAFAEAPGAVLTVAAPVEAMPAEEVARLRVARAGTALATDDWPHLYLSGRRIPRLYLGVLSGVIVLAGLVVLALGRPVGLAPSLHFLLLGAGFMLLETRSITKIALLFGATWLVTAIVIAFILACVGLANLLVHLDRAPPPSVTLAGLGTSLLLGYFVSIDRLLQVPWALRIPAAGAWVALPVLFASMLFSRSFARTTSPAAAFGANLVGVVLGGVVEYLSMVVGLNALYLVALVMYTGAAAAGVAWRRSASPA